MTEMQFPEMGSDKIRVILLGSMTSAYYSASENERRERILPRFKQLTEEWVELGAKVLGTLDDDLFMVGEYHGRSPAFYLLFDVTNVETVSRMIQRIRESVDGVRLDQYVRFESRLGRPFFLLESPTGGAD